MWDKAPVCKTVQKKTDLRDNEDLTHWCSGFQSVSLTHNNLLSAADMKERPWMNLACGGVRDMVSERRQRRKQTRLVMFPVRVLCCLFGGEGHVHRYIHGFESGFFSTEDRNWQLKKKCYPIHLSLSFIGIFCRILLRQWFLDQHAELQTNCLQSTCHFIEGSGAILTSGLAYKKYVIPTPLYRAAYSIRVLKVQYARILGDTLVQSASCFLRSWKTWLENSVM